MKQTKSRIAHITVSHGSFGRNFAYFASLQRLSIVQPEEKIPYCGVAALKIHGNSYGLVLSGGNSHLSVTDAVEEDELQYA